MRVKAFGFNRTEVIVRSGAVPVQMPKVMGIECVGLVEDPSDSGLMKGQKVAALHPGQMGFSYNGSYAEFVLVPADCVFPLETTLDWATLAAIPETFQVVWGTLNKALECCEGQTLLIRGGTSSLGMAAARMAKRMGLTVLSTTRNPGKIDCLVANGVDHAIIDDGAVGAKVREIYPDGVDRVLEIVGVDTLMDSAQAVKDGYTNRTGGIICVVGLLGGTFSLPDFSPVMLPHCVKLTSYQGAARDMNRAELELFVKDVEAGREDVVLDRTFAWSDVVEAHRYMESNKASGKCVAVLPD